MPAASRTRPAPATGSAPAEDASARMADRLRLLYTVTAPCAEPLGVRITRALALTATLLDLDLGVFSHIVGDAYTVVAVNDASQGVVPGDVFSLGDTYCAITLHHDDVFAVSHVGASEHRGHACYASSGMERYIGIPVRAGGALHGTLGFSGAAPGPAFTDADLDLLRVLAMWVGGAMEQQAAQREAAEQAALVQGLYGAAPLMMGVVELVGEGEAADIVHHSDNAATAAHFGTTPEAIRGRRASASGVSPRVLALWTDAYRRAGATGAPVSFEYEDTTPDGPIVLSATVARITPADPVGQASARFCYVATDITEQRRALLDLARSERRAGVLAGATFEGLAFSRGGVVLDANEQFAALLGYAAAADLVGLDALGLVTPASAEIARTMVAEGRPEAYEVEMIRPDGARIWVEAQGRVVPYADGEPARMTALRDVSGRKAAEAQIRFQADVLAHVSDAVVALDLDGRVTYWNAGAERLHGLPAATVLGRPLGAVVRYALPDAPAGAPPAADLLDTETGDLVYESPTAGRRTVSVSASILRDADGAERGVLAVLRDVTPERELAAQMAHQALHDALTGLPNRLHFRQHVERALRRGAPFGVLYVDLDHFKTVNDTLGHDAGDRLLLDVAGRMQAAAGPGAVVARLGGDEFALALPGDALGAADRLLDVLRRPVEVGRREVLPSASLGLVRHAERYRAPEALLRDADTAMYHAKRSGRGRVVVFDDAMHRAVAERFALEHDLRAGLRAGQFCIRLQPIVDLRTGAVAGFESLVRWEHPTRGLLGPSHFVDLAEELGLIAEIDALALDATCREVARWAAESGRAVGDLLTMVNVNCSDQSFLGAGLAERALAAAAAAGIPPACLTLELTERALVDANAVGGVAGAIRASGLKLCVDDFGAGYSSLGLLHRLPVDGLKIDRSFVTDLGASAAAEAVVRAVVQFSADLGLRTVAEGIETPHQLHILRALGCRYGQGYLFSPPVAPRDARAMLDAPPWATQWPMDPGR